MPAAGLRSTAKSVLPRCAEARGMASTAPLWVPMQMCLPASSIPVGAPSR